MEKEENPIRYFSLDEAREEIKKRWNNIELKKKIEAVLNEKAGLISVFLNDKPQAVIWRSMLSPDNGFDFYYQASNYIGLGISPLEFLDDKFVTINEEKQALSRIRLNTAENNRCYVELVDYVNQEGKALKDVILRDGRKLHDFHQELFEKNYDNLTTVDISTWCKQIGSAKDYYYYLLLHFLCHGVLFECFSLEIDNEDTFTNNVIIPAIKKVRQVFGFDPLLIRLYPENQTTDEDFYWFSYPKQINDSIVRYTEENKYLITKYK